MTARPKGVARCSALARDRAGYVRCARWRWHAGAHTAHGLHW